ncbi:MerR family transcriptional regulator [Erythrobacter sp. EC-HK427]|uniref:MerR family transcriptional regulator n=1 Tax=Erythrobacter sp. EC-HK427 TaxID=2038396 RepID=UPI00125C133A|nr:MerR family transcriptional regulator [Erythrobacter sp. EC-HK427]VVT18982.1 Transcriptional regulator, MerR family [Erythrobacter sp. EC-HK427]
MSGAASSSGPRFHDGKAVGAMRTIGEVSAAFNIKPHVLRYWESKFPMLAPLKRSGGRRLYRPEDVALVERIDRLVNREGYTLNGAKKALQGAASAAPARSAIAASVSAQTDADMDAVARQLRSIRDRLSAALSA